MADLNGQSLNTVFKPRRIAVTGVSPNPKSVSGLLLSNLVNGGFRGVLYPVSVWMEAVSGIPCVNSVADLPRIPELAGRKKLPRSPKLGIVTNAGGPGIMTADALVEAGGMLAPPLWR
jgi:acyl-CoA synthetase (NDP forming)